jgi:hypothetical protein
MKTNKSPKIDGKQYLRYMKTYLWALRHTKEELMTIVSGKYMDNYPVSALSLDQAITDMVAESELRQTGLSITDLYAIKEAVNLIDKQNVTETTSTTDGNGHQEDEVSDGHLPLQGDSKILDQPVKEGATRSRKSNKSKHDGGDPLLG